MREVTRAVGALPSSQEKKDQMLYVLVQNMFINHWYTKVILQALRGLCRLLFGDHGFSLSIMSELAHVLMEWTDTHLGFTCLGHFHDLSKEFLVGILSLAGVSHFSHDFQILPNGVAVLPWAAILKGGTLACDTLHFLGEGRVRARTSLEGGAFGHQLTVADGERGLSRRDDKIRALHKHNPLLISSSFKLVLPTGPHKSYSVESSFQRFAELTLQALQWSKANFSCQAMSSYG